MPTSGQSLRPRGCRAPLFTSSSGTRLKWNTTSICEKSLRLAVASGLNCAASSSMTASTLSQSSSIGSLRPPRTTPMGLRTIASLMETLRISRRSMRHRAALCHRECRMRRRRSRHVTRSLARIAWVRSPRTGSRTKNLRLFVNPLFTSVTAPFTCFAFVPRPPRVDESIP